jgi:hypothetical protein
MKKITFNFNPILSTKKILGSLDERPRNVLEERFGLRSNVSRTLESIGREYGITRERVRQIEAFALTKLRKSDEFDAARDVFEDLKGYIEENACLVQEEDFLSSLAKQEEHKRHILFLLVVAEGLERLKEDEYFHRSWTTDSDKAASIKEALQRLHDEIDDTALLSEEEVFVAFERHLRKTLAEETEKEILASLLKVSRVLETNALGEWGLVFSPHIRPRGMRDYAFLVMRKHGSPMHFSEIASAINEFFDKPAHVQTVHNELIKDDNFVLVGRGLYALKEWGYEGGIVRNVIEKILSENGPLSKEEIIKRVLKERYVKENTILVNLQNRDCFKKDDQGNYTIL